MTDKPKPRTIDPRIFKAFGHPERQRILVVLNRRVASAGELAAELEEPLSNVHYHLRILRECGAIEQARKVRRGNVYEYFYRATMRPHFDDETWALLPPSARLALFGDMLEGIWGDVAEAGEAGVLDDPENHITHTPLDLDEKAYEELVGLLNATLERAFEIQAAAAPRLAKLDPEERDLHATTLAMMHVHRASGARASRRGKSADKDAPAEAQGGEPEP